MKNILGRWSFIPKEPNADHATRASRGGPAQRSEGERELHLQKYRRWDKF